jgi:hypothetical protein
MNHVGLGEHGDGIGVDSLPQSRSSSLSVFGISLQQQPTTSTCVQTCLAMALNVPVALVIERYGANPMNQRELIAALGDCGFVWNQLMTGELVHRGWYFAVVPSLNRRGGMHQVLLYHTMEEGMRVLDPAIGERYRDDGTDLCCWVDLTPFWPGSGRLPK